jgi:predicted nucleic acid-binding protein
VTRLVVDASALVAELLRARGRALLTHPDVEWVASEEVADEVRHEVARRTALLVHRHDWRPEDGSTLARRALDLFADNVAFALRPVYEPFEALARQRLADDQDWSTAALALVLGAAIWTEDNDFCGIGLPTWKTRALLTQLSVSA